MTPQTEPLGRRHPLVRRLRTLKRDRAARDREQVIVGEGLHLAGEALASGAEVELALVSPRIETVRGGTELRHRLEQAGVELYTVADDVLRGLQDARSPQPVLVVVRRRPPSWDALWAARADVAPLILAACRVQDPGNLGAMLRTADAAGASGFVAVGEGADLGHPRTVRATMGSCFRLPAIPAAPEQLLESLRARGVVALGSDPAHGIPYDRFDYRQPVALLLGGEGGGLPAELRHRVDAVVSIPIAAGVDSLSVGAATAVLMFEAARQRRGGSPAESALAANDP